MSWSTAELEGEKNRKNKPRLDIFAVAYSQNDMSQSSEAGLEPDIKGGLRVQLNLSDSFVSHLRCYGSHVS